MKMSDKEKYMQIGRELAKIGGDLARICAELSGEELSRCGKCWAYLDAGDIYCRKCGAKQIENVDGGPDFDPEDNVSDPVYGPEW
jgi:ribosomal protein L40E